MWRRQRVLPGYLRHCHHHQHQCIRWIALTDKKWIHQLNFATIDLQAKFCNNLIASQISNKVGFMREGRLLAENSPAGLHQIYDSIDHQFINHDLKFLHKIRLRQFNKKFPSTAVFIYLTPWSTALLQEHRVSSLEGVFLQLCQVLIYISSSTGGKPESAILANWMLHHITFIILIPLIRKKYNAQVWRAALQPLRF